jgi:hypothetical protein
LTIFGDFGRFWAGFLTIFGAFGRFFWRFMAFEGQLRWVAETFLIGQLVSL